MITKLKLNKLTKAHEELKENAEQSLRWYHENVKEIYGIRYLCFTEFDEGLLCFEGEEDSGCGCCSGTNHSFDLNEKIMYDQEYRNMLIEKKNKEEEKKKEAELLKEEKKKEAQKRIAEEKKDKEYMIYLKIKKEQEGRK